MYFLNQQTIVAASGVAVKDLAIANGVTVYTKPIKVDRNVGTMTLLIKENKPGGAGNIGVYAEWSMDGTNFYRANSTTGGTLTQESNIVTAVTSATKWIVFPARLANFVRLALVAAADAQVTADLIYQEDE